MQQYTTEQILNVMAAKNYPVFNDGSSNLIAIRSANPTINTFSDLYYKIKYIAGSPIGNIYKFTTLPGLTYLKTPDEDSGCAILVPNFYKDMWQVGLHKEYTALVQLSDCQVYRDNLRNGMLVYDPSTIETGNFGIDNHRAYATGIAYTIDNCSAGCQVFQNADEFNEEFMPDILTLQDKFGNAFSYGLLKEEDFQ